MSRSKVAVDISPLESGHKVRGIGFHLVELKKAIEKQKTDLDIEFVNFYKTDLSEYDLVHYPYFSPFADTFPNIDSAKKYVVTIHDLIQLIYPKHYPGGTSGALKLRSQKKKVKNAAGILTISETSKKDICRFFNINPSKVKVVHLAAKSHFNRANKSERIRIRKKYNLPQKYVLYVGDINYNKNIPNLIRACSLAKVPLVMIGKHAETLEDKLLGMPPMEGPRDWYRFLTNKTHPEIAHYKTILDEIKNHGNVIITGFVTDRELNAIYSAATVYCQPSYYEGFGLNPLEAQKCETPVVASRTQALVEILGDSIVYFNPRDVVDMAKKFRKVFTNKSVQKELIIKGTKNVNNFSWEKTANETINFYKSQLK